MTFEELKNIKDFDNLENKEDIKNSCLTALFNSDIPKELFIQDVSMSIEGLLKFTLDYFENNPQEVITEYMVQKPLRKAIYSGSFDPFTLGHLDIVKRAADIFDEVHIVIAINIKKKRFLDKNLCAKAIDEVLKREGILNCKVVIWDGLVAEYCEKEDIRYSVRGLRDNMDYNYEEQISNINAEINPSLKTIYLRAERNVSSSMVKELFSYNKDISKYVPEEINFLMIHSNNA